MHVQSALFFTRIFPPPSSGSEILTGPDGSGTWRTTDADETAVVKNVIRNIVLIDVCFCLFCRPVQQRIVFNDIVRCVVFKNFKILASRRMFCSQTGDPDLVSVQRSFKRFNFADKAALLAQFHGIVKIINGSSRHLGKRCTVIPLNSPPPPHNE